MKGMRNGLVENLQVGYACASDVVVVARFAAGAAVADTVAVAVVVEIVVVAVAGGAGVVVVGTWAGSVGVPLVG